MFVIILLSNRPSLATSGSSSQNTSKPYYLLLMKQICNVMFVQKIIIFALICVYIPAVVVQLGSRLIFSTIPKKSKKNVCALCKFCCVRVLLATKAAILFCFTKLH